MTHRIKHIFDNTVLFIIKLLFYINLPRYMKSIVSFYKKRGMNFCGGGPNYISNTVYFDGTDFSLISIGIGVTLSMDVSILTHDGSLKTLYVSMDGIDDYIDTMKSWHKTDMCRLRGKVVIGDYSFIGAKAFLLPGTTIGHHCIIGAGSVVKGNVPDYSIVYGNPGKIHGDTRDLLKRKAEQYKSERYEYDK